MAQLDDGGWLYIGYGDGTYQCIVRCEDYEWDEVDDSATFIDYPADGHYGYTLDTKKRKIKIKELFFDNKADFDLFLVNLDALQSGGAFDLRIKCNSDNSWIKWNGTNITMPVLFKTKKGIKKSFRGDTTIYTIKMIEFNQAGNLYET